MYPTLDQKHGVFFSSFTDRFIFWGSLLQMSICFIKDNCYGVICYYNYCFIFVVIMFHYIIMITFYSQEVEGIT